ncbi:vacuolar ATPase assembly integral membrane protein VMA21 homolog [Copidosoma floridanum]|uniref:vacuolar ATPase assembly integral membrane protein VMA21 homolog n=1 Tax=Copidosoma floridanum TaxID=29053 RepID=UPI0006C945E2|nr:vacuolar ATPase assembly integral membrane protein VMA21 homolog [Copidosoma floridanum]
MTSRKESTELQVFKTVLIHCIIIIACPVLSFFGSKVFIFDGLLNLSAVSSNVYAALTAVIVLHVALGMFIYRAYFDSPTKAPWKAD